MSNHENIDPELQPLIDAMGEAPVAVNLEIAGEIKSAVAHADATESFQSLAALTEQISSEPADQIDETPEPTTEPPTVSEATSKARDLVEEQRQREEAKPVVPIMTDKYDGPEIKKRRDSRFTRGQKTGAFIVGVLALGSAAAGIFSFPDGEANERPRVLATASPTPSPTPSPEATPNFDNPAFREAFNKSFHEKMPGFKPGEVAIGNEVDYTKNPQKDRGTATFGKETIDSRSELVEFLSSKDRGAVAVRTRIQSALKDKPEELKRALSGEGYVPVQFKVDIAVEGTTYFVRINGKDQVLKVPGKRKAEAGDIFWVFVDSKGNIISEASLRADCVNPEFKIIRPIKPGEKIPPIEKVPDGIAPGDQGVSDEKGEPNEQENNNDPQNNSDTDGFGQGDSKPTPKPNATPEPTPEPTPTYTPNAGGTPPPSGGSTPPATPAAAPRTK